MKDKGDIEVIDIDSFVEEIQLKSVDFIKIDTEGGEEAVVAGMDFVLTQYHPDLWIEVNTTTYESILSKLRKHDYVLVDVMGFNLLLLHPSRHSKLEEVSNSVILSALFNNIEKADKYYQHYETAKGWLRDKDQQLQTLTQNNAALNAKYKTAVENYAKVKDWLSAKEQSLNKANNTIQSLTADKCELQKQNQTLQLQKEEQDRSSKLLISQLQEQLEIAERNCKDSNNLLHSFTQDEHQTQLVLQKAQRLIQKQQAEIQLMRVDVDNYRRLVHKITDPWYGRLLLKCYRLLQKFNILK